VTGFTHSQLVEIGRKWLLKPWRNASAPEGGHGACSVVITDMTSAAWETPDVFGWHGGFSVLLECKASRADFLADRKKYHRVHPEMGLGCQRYYVAPRGLISKDELPDKWGLVEIGDKGNTRVVQPSMIFDANVRAEVSILLSLLRRLKVKPGRHVAIRAYTSDSDKEPRATVTLGSNADL
jgi:hypothetical protein